MKLIDVLGLKNFRIFDDQTGFFEELSLINIITGPNNSGKSLIVKAFQMLMNSVKGYRYPFDLDLNQQEHLLGDFNNVLFNKENKQIEISLPFLFFGIGNLYINLTFIIPDSQNPYDAKLRTIKVFDKKDKGILFSFHYREATEDEVNAYKNDYQEKLEAYEKEDKELSKKPPEELLLQSILHQPPHDNPLLAFVEWQINFEKLKFYLDYLRQFYEIYLKDKKNWDENHLEEIDKRAEAQDFLFIPTTVLKLFKNDLNIDNWKDFIKNKLSDRKIIEGKAQVGEHDFFDEPFYPIPEIEHVLFHKSLNILRDYLLWNDDVDAGTNSVMEHCFRSGWETMIQRISSIIYVSNIKEENARGYNAASNSPFISLLKKYQSSKIDTEFIDKYLKKFEIGTEINISHQPNYQLILVSIKTMDGKIRELVDFGYGIKQIVLILIQVSVLAKQNYRIEQRYGYDGEEMHEYYEPSLLIIEEPESNLHPKWQSLLADMLSE